jgi:hypothetical protein
VLFILAMVSPLLRIPLIIGNFKFFAIAFRPCFCELCHAFSDPN